MFCKGAREPTKLYRLVRGLPGLDQALQETATIWAATKLLDKWVCPYLFNYALSCNYLMADVTFPQLRL